MKTSVYGYRYTYLYPLEVNAKLLKFSILDAFH